ncbi:elongator complex protein 5 [Ostrinia furnacalis]|uniref:elongator complex protein 5 n=1 Tax=Ostrinia furnacalis TaxID=93504 RepID=UPI00103C54F2|nr:elongator complex protein 5 [Ostrinia furnacalis]
MTHSSHNLKVLGIIHFNLNPSQFNIMSLLRLKSAPFILIEDNLNKNIVPLLLEITPTDACSTQFFCYEQPIFHWKNVFKGVRNVVYHEELDKDSLNKYVSEKCSVIIDSVNQMSLCLGWNECLKVINKLRASPNVNKLILVHHTDCSSFGSKLRIQLNHIASAIVSYDDGSNNNVHILLKKSGKVVKSSETLSYDVRTSTLKSIPIVKNIKAEDEPEKPSPVNLTTFKIEVDQTEKLEKYKLQLPYMSKINEGQGKIFYEPDAVDDWDEEDPDEDLDI